MKKYFAAFLILFAAASCNNSMTSSSPQVPNPTTNNESTSSPVSNSPAPTLFMPISGGLSRVTKKMFGTYVTPKNSPVQPEKFTGYHAGIDFETYDSEKDSDVTISAACDGKLLTKKYATGYGGLAVQSCTLDGNPVTIIYGHLRLSSITLKVGDQLKPGDKIAVLGTGYSSETDGERKHLHFAIHKGSAVNILGYVQNKADLSGWLDPETIFQ